MGGTTAQFCYERKGSWGQNNVAFRIGRGNKLLCEGCVYDRFRCGSSDSWPVNACLEDVLDEDTTMFWRCRVQIGRTDSDWVVRVRFREGCNSRGPVGSRSCYILQFYSTEGDTQTRRYYGTSRIPNLIKVYFLATGTNFGRVVGKSFSFVGITTFVFIVVIVPAIVSRVWIGIAAAADSVGR